ncbi:PspC domain-containing protein [Nakamurella leprariae]|uniref:PspC domain-containing protein n=1 Tax=Nakamurella leprariae TaxID=2803911 RepID=A0A938Y7T2_9ACTN|nr:PspC domain-containing protein [Nakamurella leprariae]MBM9467611.1 PspC domain-containing protein [Nakamurella leprariae]
MSEHWGTDRQQAGSRTDFGTGEPGSAADRGPGSEWDGWWARRPRRSVVDRKVAGVAGGLGRSLGIDPVLIRVVFVVLTVFGGAGAVLYLLGWLLLPADGDEVSAAEALLGRGRSSVPPVVTVGLAVIAAIAAAGAFSWGLPFWLIPVAIVTAVVLTRKHAFRHAGGCGRHQGRGQRRGRPGAMGGPPPEWVRTLQEQSQQWGRQAQDWVERQPWAGSSGPSGRRPGSGWGGSDSASAPTGPVPGSPESPFDGPASWDRPAETDPATGEPKVSLRKPAAGEAPDPVDQPQQPPAWDPLGVAPFAWDLPDPAPAPTPAPPRRDRAVLARIALGLALLSGALAATGVFAGWWQLSWAAVAAIPLTVVALGLIVGSLVWRRGRLGPLVGPGIFLGILTAGLAMTGLTGTDGFGESVWRPTTVAELESDYLVNGGNGVLDLRGLTLPDGVDRSVDVTVRAGQAEVIVPEELSVSGSCHVNAGQVDCFGVQQNGLDKTVPFADNRSQNPDAGTLELNVTVGAGNAEVRRG